MANETILEIPQTLTAATLPGDASMEGQSVSLGSFQLPMSALNVPLASGVFTINSATAVNFTVAYGTTFGVAPTRIRLTLIMPSTGATMPGLGAASIGISNFALCLTGPTGTTTHKVFWEALP